MTLIKFLDIHCVLFCAFMLPVEIVAAIVYIRCMEKLADNSTVKSKHRWWKFWQKGKSYLFALVVLLAILFNNRITKIHYGYVCLHCFTYVVCLTRICKK